MLSVPGSIRIFVCRDAVDFRKAHDGERPQDGDADRDGTARREMSSPRCLRASLRGLCAYFGWAKARWPSAQSETPFITSLN